MGEIRPRTKIDHHAIFVLAVVRHSLRCPIVGWIPGGCDNGNQRSDISVGTYLAYAGMVVYIIYPLRNLGRVIVQTSTGMVSYGRVMDIIKETREPLELGDYLPAEQC